MMAMIRKHKWGLAAASLVILLPMVLPAAGGLRWMPPVLLAFQWFGLLLTFRDWQKHPQGRKALGIVLWVLPAISLLGAAVSWLAVSGAGAAQVGMTVLFCGMGLLFLVLGNRLPKIRRNRTLGIKVRWSMENEENWNATHRFAGRIWVACGIAAMVCALLPLDAGIPLFTAVILAAAAAPCVYSYRYYRRQLAAGTAVKLPRKPWAAAATAALTVAAAAFVAWVLLSGSLAVTCGPDGVTADASGWPDWSAGYGEITAVELLADPPDGGVRTNGFGNVRFAMGRFENDAYGTYLRYTHASCGLWVVLTMADGETVVLNGADEAETRQLYEDLLARTGGA